MATKVKSQKSERSPVAGRTVRRASVVKLINEYIKSHAPDQQTKTLLRAIRHDVIYDLPNVSREQSQPWTISAT